MTGPVRDLSLWEWRHWQNQPLPTHRVDHSNRCLHFTAIMELIDQMRQEEEVRHGGNHFIHMFVCQNLLLPSVVSEHHFGCNLQTKLNTVIFGKSLRYKQNNMSDLRIM